MNPFLKEALENITLLVDTREQPTKRLKDRIEKIGFLYKRRKLDVGDYSCECKLNTGEVIDFSSMVAIERKMNLDELCMCFGKERERFKKEFERAKEKECKIYLIVENASWEKAYDGKYRSLLNPNALIASLNAFRVRYGMQIDFCKEETSGKLIRDILYREVKNYLENLEKI